MLFMASSIRIWIFGSSCSPNHGDPGELWLSSVHLFFEGFCLSLSHYIEFGVNPWGEGFLVLKALAMNVLWCSCCVQAGF